MKRFVVLLIAIMFLFPILANASAKEEKVFVEVDFQGKKLLSKEMSPEDAQKLEEKILRGDVASLGIKFDIGMLNYIVSYGKGKIWMPLHTDRSFLRMVIFPIFFNYEKGLTLMKFGGSYFWKGKSIRDFGIMTGKQCGIIFGFMGLHVKISHKLRPDTHIFIGGSAFTIGWDRFL